VINKLAVVGLPCSFTSYGDHSVLRTAPIWSVKWFFSLWKRWFHKLWHSCDLCWFL